MWIQNFLKLHPAVEELWDFKWTLPNDISHNLWCTLAIEFMDSTVEVLCHRSSDILEAITLWKQHCCAELYVNMIYGLHISQLILWVLLSGICLGSLVHFLPPLFFFSLLFFLPSCLPTLHLFLNSGTVCLGNSLHDNME